jgi:methionine biosynthesis protein MetW
MTISLDHRFIFEMIDAGASVLDLGCGDGELLALLNQKKNVKSCGIELDEKAIYSCVEKGVTVLHGDIDSGLSEYADKSFDYVILNQSLQQVSNLQKVLTDSLRVGRKVIVGFPNFTYWVSRLQFFFIGKAPVTASLPYTWFESPNKHFFSIEDFRKYCLEKNIRIEAECFIGTSKRVYVLPNFFARTGVFLISKTSC